jgi:flavin-dependent dehydrogenase
MKEMFYFQDETLTNCGGWYHPTGKHSFLIGDAEFTSGEYLTREELKKRLDLYIKKFYPLSKFVKNAKKVKEYCIVGPITTEHSQMAQDNYLAVGDAAGAGSPFIGEGLRQAFDMGISAYETIIEASKKKDFSEKILSKHWKFFKKTYGKWYKWSYLIRFIYLRYLTNKELNMLVPRMEQLNYEEYYNFITSKITLWLIWRIFGFKVGLYVLKNMFVYHVLEPLGIAKIQRRPLKI